MFVETNRSCINQSQQCLQILKEKEAELLQLNLQIQEKLKNIGKKIKRKTINLPYPEDAPAEYSKLKLINYKKVQGDHELEFDRPQTSLNLPKPKAKPEIRLRKSASVIESSSPGIKETAGSRQIRSDRNCISISHNNSMISLNSGTDKLNHSSCDNSVSGRSSKKLNVSSSNSKLVTPGSKIPPFTNIGQRESCKLEMLKNAKSITYNLLYKIVNLKKISKKESSLL